MEIDTHNHNIRQFQQSIEPYFSEYYQEKVYPGLILEQGKRKMVQINVSAGDLLTLLQAKPSTNNDPDSGKNRSEDREHVKEIKEYILDRAKNDKPWILGTLTANVDPQGINVIELGRGICLVVIKRQAKLDITDGQHRKRAIQELMLSSDYHLIADNDFPITLVLEGAFNQCQTDFRDMAQTKPLDKSLLLSFGEFEGRIGIMKRIIEEVRMFSGKTAKTSDVKVSPKRKILFLSNSISRFVSYVFTDEPDRDLKDYDVETYSLALINSLNNFFSTCEHTRHISETPLERLEVEKLVKFKEDCILIKAVALETLAKLMYSTYRPENNTFDPQKMTQLAQFNWSKNNPIWDDNIGNATQPKHVKIAVEKVKAALYWV